MRTGVLLRSCSPLPYERSTEAMVIGAVKRRKAPSPAGVNQRQVIDDILADFYVGVTHADERAARAAEKCQR